MQNDVKLDFLKSIDLISIIINEGWEFDVYTAFIDFKLQLELELELLNELIIELKIEFDLQIC